MIDRFIALLGLDTVFYYMDKRIAQLDRQEKLDKKLEELNDTCPKILVEFYQAQRQLNRDNSKKTYTSDIFNKFETLDEILKQIDKIDNSIFKILETGNKKNKCKQLNYFLKNKN